MLPRAPIAVLLSGGLLTLAGAGCGDLTNNNPDLIAGKKAFTEKCGACHTLNRAGTKGIQGPNLDNAFRQPIIDGMGRNGIQSMVHAQILHPAMVPSKNPAYMPPKLAQGQEAENIAAYVASAVAKPGKDSGLLAQVGQSAGGGKPAVESGGVLKIPATSQLAYVTKTAQAKAGKVRIQSPNPSGTPHDIAIEGNGVKAAGKVVSNGGVSQVDVTLKPGVYTFYCTVPGHREAGMQGKLTVK